MSAIYFVLRWAALVALLLAVNAIYGCGHAPSGLRFDYHGFSELQVMELDCVLGLMPDTLTAGGDVWLQPEKVFYNSDNPALGRTNGMDDYLRIELANIPAMPQVFVHELMHVLAGQETGDRDADHNDARYFGRGSLDSVYEYQAYELCQR